MATSVLMASEKNLAELEDFSRSENTKQSGRRKSKSNESVPKKKKQPQRGMGVAQLERLRLQDQDRWKKITQTTTTNPLPQSLNPFFPPSSSFPNPISSNGLAQLGLNQALMRQRIRNGGFSGTDSYGFGGLNLGLQSGFNVEELSSIPNLRSYNYYSDDQHCGLCHKKKRVNGENFGLSPPINGCDFLGLNLRNKRIVDGENQDLGMGALGYGGGNVDQEVEVVAVHRKGSSGGGGGNVFMEFEFFPGKDGVRGTSSKDYMDLTGGSSSSEASVIVAADQGSCFTAPTTTFTGFDSSSTSVDLSLKLSY
ncbi:hypothetical protein HYC85_011674 [Camellia sinensis]|uniref:Uncharacterized protein n=1 Tax=Camellia sinensis TaxID=4442 RepID=A0A7J7HBM3_CAMSI|nr:hypothetical protein HYC85_011674 [Camellia sinensis]